ncbi:MAG: ubiquinol-cytochrome c reductase iron-sulfur subunit [Nocardioidaceae bacterium]|nr:ubiquinol-cytochrome c reductase iron-sulfur subunit [Nocardioidaceae bacterium]
MTDIVPGSREEHSREIAPTDGDPIADPGLPAHVPRPTDVDTRAEKRAERQIATLFGLSSLMAILFCVAYFAFHIGDNPTVFLGFGASNVALGVTLGLALLFIGIGAIQWSRKLMNDTEIVEMRHPVRSSDQDREESVAALTAGLNDSGLGRRPLIRNSLLGAMGAIMLPVIVALRDLGPLPGDKLYHTVWTKGMRVVNDVAGTPIKPEWVRIGQLVNAEPEIFFNPEAYNSAPFEGAELQAAKAKAALIVVRMQPDDITPLPGRENWGVNGILAYSKICTHVGCPISLWEQQTHHLLCPCHQSTFDLADNGKVIFGPAARPLPQLPIAVDSEGYLIATHDFYEPVGPSFWERG